MSFIVDFTERLLAVRSALADNTQINDPENYSKLTGYLNFLHSPINPKTIDTIMRDNSLSGQYRAVDIRYNPHWGDEDTVIDDANSSCDPVNQRRDYIETVEPTLYVESKFTLDEDYLRLNTEDYDSADGRLARSFQKAMRVGREKMNEQLLAAAALKIGSNPAAGVSSGGFKQIQMIKSDGSLNVDTFDEILNDLEDNFMTGTPAIIGLGNARKVFNRLAVGNLNTSAGVDFAQIREQFGSILFKDQFAASQLGGSANRVLVAYPGLSQFFHYNVNRGFFAQNVADLRIKGTMPDPVYPFEWDYILEYDNNCSSGNGIQGAWTVRVFCYYDLFTVPERAFGDLYGELNDFTGLLGYEITSA